MTWSPDRTCPLLVDDGEEEMFSKVGEEGSDCMRWGEVSGDRIGAGFENDEEMSILILKNCRKK